MRSKLGRLGVLVVAVIGLVASCMSPAHASTVGTALLAGNMVTGPLGYPCTPVGTTTNCPPPTDKGQQPTRGFTFASATCVGEKTDVKPTSGKGVGTYGPLCQIQAAGVITGYCGLMLGSGTGTLTWFGIGDPKTVNFSFTFKDLGGTAVITGTAEKGTITGVWEFIPDPFQGGSCAEGTETNFIITGEATLTEITVLP